MIIPTPRAIYLMLAGAPLLVAIALLAPSLWILAGGWIVLVLGLMGLDAVLSAALRAYRPVVTLPPLLHVGARDTAQIELSFETGALPHRIEVHLETGTRLELPAPVILRGWEGRRRAHKLELYPVRRGTAEVLRLWSRWRGPLGLVQKRHALPINREIPVLPNIRWVRDEAIRIFSRDSDFGIKEQLERGDGSEFDALREFSAGMDRRAIDWKHSARHRHLLAKEFKTERNHNIVLMFDTGRLMSEPLAGVPKIDRAVMSGLLLGYVSLRYGDRVMVQGFASQPSISSGFVHGISRFPRIQTVAARLDYSDEEANFTLALSQLASDLERRSLIVIFSDFVDTISAELMLENIRRLTKRHLVLFATFEDEALLSMINTPPDSAEMVSRAVIADELLAERELVFRRLQRLGVHIVESRPENFGPALLSQYLTIKTRELL